MANKITRHALTVKQYIALVGYLEEHKDTIVRGRLTPTALAESATKVLEFVVKPANVRHVMGPDGNCTIHHEWPGRGGASEAKKTHLATLDSDIATIAKVIKQTLEWSGVKPQDFPVDLAAKWFALLKDRGLLED